MVFGNGVKNIQAVAYNGARTVCSFRGNMVLLQKGFELHCAKT